MKQIDRIFNGIIIKCWYSNKIVWSTFSFIKWLFTGKRYLRADYIEYISSLYARNNQKRDGYLPIDFNHTKESYWLKLLKDDKGLKEYFKL